MIFKHIYKFLNNKKLPLLIIVLFFILRLRYFTTDIYFPDEIHHTFLMSKIGNFINQNLSLHSYPSSKYLLALKEIISENSVQNNIYNGELLNKNFSNIFLKVFGKISNYEGFGATYWVLGGILSAVTKDFRLVLRILSLLSICLAAFYFYRSLRTDNIIRSFSTLLFLSTPFLWYGGKLITPEFYILPIIFFAYYKFFQDSSFKINSIFLGLAVGIKSSIAPALFPYLLEFFKNIKFHLLKKKVIILFLLFIFGLIISSPNLIWDPLGYFNSIPKNYQISKLLNLEEISFKAIKLWNQGFIIQREWDLVVSSGYFKVVPSPGTKALTIVPFFKEDEFIIGSIKTISPSAIHASIIESPLTESANKSFFLSTSVRSRLSLTSEKVSINPPAATEPIIGTPSSTSSTI